jgi:hypothetical protein
MAALAAASARLAMDPYPPHRRESCASAIDAHGEFCGIGFRRVSRRCQQLSRPGSRLRRWSLCLHRLDLRHGFQCSYRSAILRRRNRLTRWRGFWLWRDLGLGSTRRLRKPRPGDGEPLAEVSEIEPPFGGQAFHQIVVPEPGELDVEFALLLLVDRLHAMAGHGPLAANPEDVAMQRHISRNFISGQMVAADGNEDTVAGCLRNREGSPER